jgi:hypothetical protein
LDEGADLEWRGNRDLRRKGKKGISETFEESALTAVGGAASERRGILAPGRSPTGSPYRVHFLWRVRPTVITIEGKGQKIARKRGNDEVWKLMADGELGLGGGRMQNGF